MSTPITSSNQDHCNQIFSSSTPNNSKSSRKKANSQILSGFVSALSASGQKILSALKNFGRWIVAKSPFASTPKIPVDHVSVNNFRRAAAELSIAQLSVQQMVINEVLEIENMVNRGLETENEEDIFSTMQKTLKILGT